MSAKDGRTTIAYLGSNSIAKITQEARGVAIWLPDPDLLGWVYMHKIVPSMSHAQSFIDTYFL